MNRKGRSLNTLLGYFRQKTLAFFGQQRGRRINQGRPGGGGVGSGIPKYLKKTFQYTKNYTKTRVKYQN